MPVILIALVYRKDGNYYLKVFLEKEIIHFDDSNDSNEKTKCINLYLKNKRIDHQSS